MNSELLSVVNDDQSLQDFLSGIPLFRLFLIAGYLLLLLHHGREGSRNTRSLSDYLIAGRLVVCQAK